MGTKFMATRESASHTNVKEAIISGSDACTVSIPKDFMIARDLTNDFTRKYLELKKSGATSSELNDYLNRHDQYRSQYLGQAAEAEICCGQVAGLISEVRGADEVMRDIVENISLCFEKLKQNFAGAF
jgi:enoyl-[acyl-carrier protein] reductase II